MPVAEASGKGGQLVTTMGERREMQSFSPRLAFTSGVMAWCCRRCVASANASATSAVARQRFPASLFCAAILSIPILSIPLAGCVSQQASVPVGEAPTVTQVPQAAAAADNLERIQAALLPPLVPPAQPGVAMELEPRFDLTVNDAPAPEVFAAIASGTRYSMVLHPAVSGQLSVKLKGVTVAEALQSIREIFGYEYRVEGTRIHILPVTLQTRVFSVSYLAGQRHGSSDIRVPSGAVAEAQRGADALADSNRLQTLTANDFWAVLSSTLKTVVGDAPGRSVAVNPDAGVVVVRAMPAELRQVAQYLNAIRDSVQRQVILEGKIVEVTLNERFQGGINWADYPQASQASADAVSWRPLPGPRGTRIDGLPGGALLGMVFPTQDFTELLQFLESQGTVEVLSSPRIATLNNQKAVFKVGTDEFFVTGISTAAAPGTPGPQFPGITMRPFFTGVALDVTPQIDEDLSVILHIRPSVSSVTRSESSLNLGSVIGSISLPLARSAVSETDSVVRAIANSVIAISGLFKVDAVDVAPAAAKDRTPCGPGLVSADRQRPAAKKELVILIRPTVVSAGNYAADNAADLRERLQNFATPEQGRGAGNP